MMAKTYICKHNSKGIVFERCVREEVVVEKRLMKWKCGR